MISNKFIISVAIAILVVLFNVYLVNVVTGYDKRPEYPDYPRTPIAYPKNGLNEEEIAIANEERDIDKQKYDEEYKIIKAERDKLAFRRHIGLLIMGIVNIVISILVTNTYIKNGIGVAGLITLIFATGSYWTRYNDKVRLGVVTAGLVIFLFIAARMYGAFRAGDKYNVFDIGFIIGRRSNPSVSLDS